MFQYNLKIDDAPILRLLDSILEEALRRNASDIHCEPGEEGTRIRCRIDGVLQQTQLVPSFRHQPLVSVIKLLGGMDIAEKRQPQDGRAFVERDGVRTDLRISTLPTLTGEKIVLRILAADRGQGKLDDRDWDARTLARYRRLYRGGCGLVLVTGPTGSGKTTTLYATLAELNHAEVNIVTLEDPVEYRLDGINQVAVNRKAGLTFVTGLRSLLRQDPDVIMVGELRDEETIATALTAAETGHLVFGTLHTSGAVEAIHRILDVFPDRLRQIQSQLAVSLAAVVSQRLLRRRDGTGRVGAYEILIMTDAMRNLVREGRMEQMRNFMQTGSRLGMQTMEQALATLRRKRLL